MTKEELDGDRVYIIHDFLSRAECAELIGPSEGLAWEVGTLGDEVVEQARNNERVLFDHPVLAADLYIRARLTFMIYLNEGAAGGETRFFASMPDAFQRQPYLTVTPKEGMALVFVHRIWHEGVVVEKGQKYVLRTDVMYGRPRIP